MSPRRRPAGDDGTVLLLIVAYFLVAAALVVVVVDTASVLLARRDLANLADGAALAAAQAVDENRVYGAGGLGPNLPLSPAGARAAVAAYLANRAADYPDLSVRAVATDGVTVTVSLADQRRLNWLGPLAGAVPGGVVELDATASARSPLR